jgi:hypothetical protein
MTNRRSDSPRTADKRHSASFDAFDDANRKIHEHHRERLAIVYVRQSSQRQVEEHRESAELQYGLTKRAEQYGWSPDRLKRLGVPAAYSARTGVGCGLLVLGEQRI